MRITKLLCALGYLLNARLIFVRPRGTRRLTPNIESLVKSKQTQQYRLKLSKYEV